MDAYIYQADIYCEMCIKGIKEAVLSDPYLTYNGDPPKGPFPDGGGEADSPQHCGTCGVFLENPLTTDGEDYVRKALTHPGILTEWEKFYDYLCNQDRPPLG